MWAFEALSAIVALTGATISARNALRRHRTLRALPEGDHRIRVALTRRRIAATFMFVQLTLLVACCYRMAHPMQGVLVPSSMRFVMACLVIRCCVLNERDWRRGAVSIRSAPVFPDKTEDERYH